MILRAYGVVTAIFAAAAAAQYPPMTGSGGMSVSPPGKAQSFQLATDPQPGGVGPVQGGSQPAPSTPEQLPPPQQSPSRPSSSDRASYEKRTGDDLSQWEKRLADLTDRAKNEGTYQRGAAERLNRELTAVKLQWENLRQTTGADWDQKKQQFEGAFARFKRDWEDATHK